MSQVRKETIECPHCHLEGEYDLWTSVNVDLDPELREKIFSDELFMYHWQGNWHTCRYTLSRQDP